MKAATSTGLAGGSPTATGPVQWLWPGYLPRGAVVVLDGDPGTGKSVLAADLAARLTRGGSWPDGTPVSKPGNAILYAAEDLRDSVVWPRLKAAGGDVSRIGVYGTPDSGEELPCFPKDLDSFAEMFGNDWPDLLVFDPLAYFLIGSGPIVRSVLGRLAVLTARHNVTMVLHRH
jgi:putative DNA primase/helicase